MIDFNLGVLTSSISCCKDEYPEMIYLQDYQNTCELDALFKEFDDKFSAYENLLALKDNITTYGYTPEISDLIGISEEGILASIGKGIGNFFKWLVDWCKRIYKFFADALSRGGSSSQGSSSKNTVASMLSSPEQYKKLKEQIKLGKLESIEIPEKHTNISNSIKPIMNDFRDALRGPGCVFMGGKDGDEIKRFEQDLSSWINSVLRDKSTVAVNRQTAMKFIIPITDDTFYMYNKVVNMAEQLKEVSSINIPDKADDKEAYQLIVRILQKLDMIPLRAGNIRRNLNDKGEHDGTERPLLEEFKSYVSSVNMLFRMFYRLFATVKQLGIRIFTQLCTNESAAKAAVFLRIKPPQHLVDKLRELWGYPKFNYREVILTNMERDYIAKNKGILGHIHGTDNPQVVWLNVTLFTNKDKFAELIDISKNNALKAPSKGVPHMYPLPTKYTTALIETLVHESRHIVQYQAKMDCVADDEENQKKYVLRLKEIDARKMAHEYVTKYLTEEDTAWAKKVISQAIAQELKHVKQYRPDAESK